VCVCVRVWRGVRGACSTLAAAAACSCLRPVEHACALELQPFRHHRRRVAWCHGGAGLIPTLVKASQVLGAGAGGAAAGSSGRYLRAAAAAAEDVWQRGLLTKARLRGFVWIVCLCTCARACHVHGLLPPTVTRRLANAPPPTHHLAPAGRGPVPRHQRQRLRVAVAVARHGRRPLPASSARLCAVWRARLAAAGGRARPPCQPVRGVWSCVGLEEQLSGSLYRPGVCLCTALASLPHDTPLPGPTHPQQKRTRPHTLSRTPTPPTSRALRAPCASGWT
jgi:hypothetical protein